jgi:hypothetical protein
MTGWAWLSLVLSASGYAVIYATMPDRRTFGGVPRSRIWRGVGVGAVLIVFSALAARPVWGSVGGPVVALSAAVATGSVLLVVVPLLRRSPPDVGEEPVEEER